MTIAPWPIMNTFTLIRYLNKPLAHITVYDAKGINVGEFWFKREIADAFIQALHDYRDVVRSKPTAISPPPVNDA
jgi:hypothetical protein